jgi:hypothetical protein
MVGKGSGGRKCSVGEGEVRRERKEKKSRKTVESTGWCESAAAI